MIFSPRRFLARMESVVIFFNFLVDFLASAFDWSELPLFVAAHRNIVFVILVELVVYNFFRDNEEFIG